VGWGGGGGGVVVCIHLSMPFALSTLMMKLSVSVELECCEILHYGNELLMLCALTLSQFTHTHKKKPALPRHHILL